MNAKAPMWFGMQKATTDERVRTRWLYVMLAVLLVAPLLVGAGIWQGQPWVVVAALAAAGLTALVGVIDLYARGWRGVWADDTGLTLVGWFGRSRQVPWADVAFASSPSPLAVVAGGETLGPGLDTARWLSLLVEVQRRVAPNADTGPPLAPEAVRDLLGISADGALEARNADHPLFGALVLLGGVLLIFGTKRAESPLVAAALLVLGVSSVARRLPGSVTVRADTDGLWFGPRRGRRRAPWSAVRRNDHAPLRNFCGRHVVTTDAGQITFDATGPGGTELSAGIDRIIAARAAGRGLPDEEPVPDGAISLARLSDTAEAGRGLSLSDGHGDQ